MCKLIIETCFILLLILCVPVATAKAKLAPMTQINSISVSAESQTRSAAEEKENASKKEKFDLCIGMLKGYYDALDSRVEKSFALLLVVVGWLITSDTARKSLAKEPALFWGAIITLTSSIVFLYLNISHFLDRFREIQHTAEQLNYVDPKYFTRYQMPKNILPFYLAPLLIIYIFVILLLFQIRYNFLSLSFSRAKDSDSIENIK